jgi:hypothetical protein
MDEYAMLLQIKCDYSRLNKLVHDLLSVDHTRAEVFVALSVLWERKDARTALSYAEKVSFFSDTEFLCQNLCVIAHDIHYAIRVSG